MNWNKFMYMYVYMCVYTYICVCVNVYMNLKMNGTVLLSGSVSEPWTEGRVVNSDILWPHLVLDGLNFPLFLLVNSLISPLFPYMLWTRLFNTKSIHSLSFVFNCSDNTPHLREFCDIYSRFRGFLSIYATSLHNCYFYCGDWVFKVHSRSSLISLGVYY